MALGNFELERPLGTGGQATVWAAFDRGLKRHVAVKVLLAEVASTPAFTERLKKEAESLARISHSNVLPILHMGELEGRPFLVLPLVNGGSLANLLEARGVLPFDEARPILRGIAAALAAAHSAGIVHRDVKPSNVLLDGPERRVLLADFGIATDVEPEEAGLTLTGVQVGTPRYMSPERHAGERTTTSSDVYSFGLVAYQTLYGAPPHVGPIADDARASASDIPSPDPPPNAAALLKQCLATNPEARPSAQGVVDQIDRIDLEAATTKGFKPWVVRLPKFMQLLLVLLAVGILGFVGLVLREPRVMGVLTDVTSKLLKLALRLL